MRDHPPGHADWCLKQLQDCDDYFLSTHLLWEKYCDDFGCHDLSCEDFEQLLRADGRLYVTPGADTAVPGPQQELLSRMGFPTLPARALVGLEGRKPSREALDNAIRAKAAHLQYALRKAWEARPLDGPEVEKVEKVEKKLLFLMEQAQKLCDTLGVGPPED